MTDEESDSHPIKESKLSIPMILAKMASEWVAKEHEWYTSSSSSYKPVSAEGNFVSTAQLQAAVDEFSQRFAFVTEDEDALISSEQRARSPYLLVATNVNPEWTVPEAFNLVRFMLVPDVNSESVSVLFITCMPGVIHGSVLGYLSDCLGEYLRKNKLQYHVVKCHSGGGTYQPDIRIFPVRPDPTPPAEDNDQDYDRPYSRLVVEFEFGNRNGSALRQVGHAALSSDYASLFLGIKVWKKSKTGVFGAAAVLWGRDPDTGVDTLLQAVDFGTKALSQATMDAWNTPGPAMLPPVGEHWTRPLPINCVKGYVPPHPGKDPLPSPPEWLLVLPARQILYRTTYASAPSGQYIMNALSQLDNLRIDLQVYVCMIDTYLDKVSA